LLVGVFLLILNIPQVLSILLIFTLQIRDDVFEGVFVKTETIASPGGVLILTDAAILYIGDWGKTNVRMNQGFSITVVIVLPDYNQVNTPLTLII
jgi:hypothetical protein